MGLFFSNFFIYDLYFIPIILLIFVYFFVYLNFKQYFSKLIILNNKENLKKLKNKYNFNYNSVVYNNLILFILNFFILLLIIIFVFLTYNYNYLSNYIFFSFHLYNYSFFYLKIITILMLYIFLIIKKNINKVKNYEILLGYFFFYICLLYYLIINNLLTLIFIFELQSITFFYFLSNLLTLKNNSNLNKNYKELWFFNSLIYQFWVSFLGVVLLVYTLLVFLKNIFFLDWINIETFIYFLNYFSYSLNLSEIIFIFLPLLIGLFLKLGLFPFFFWKPEIYKNLSLDAIFIYMTIYTFSTIVFIIFFITSYFFLVNKFLYLYINLVIVISVIVLPIIFYSITEIRVFLSYTYIFHVLLIISSLFFNNYFYLPSFFYLFIYTFFSFYLFVLFYYISNYNVWYFTDFQFFYKNNLINLVIFGLLLGMSGIPPFFGFFSKLFIISNILFNQNYFFFIIFFVSGLMISFYYIQNYRFFGYSLKNINFSKNYLLINFNSLLVNYLIIFIFFNLFSYFFFNEILIVSFLFKLN